MMNNKGILIVISGFSGAGKGTLVKGLMNSYNNYALSISATTRNPRTGELNGREYFFKTREDFMKMIDENELIEYAEYVGNFYGTPKEYVDSQLNNGKDVILEIEIQGALKVKEKFPETLLLFISPPSAEVLKNRLVGRGTEDIKTIESRLKRASKEAEGIEEYDYFIINDDLDECIVRTHGIIQSEHSRASRNISNIEKIREELKNF